MIKCKSTAFEFWTSETDVGFCFIYCHKNNYCMTSQNLLTKVKRKFTRRLMKILLLIALLLFGLIGPITVSLYFLYGNRHIDQEFVPSDYGIDYEPVTFNPRGDDINLDGWFIPANAALGEEFRNNSTIILLHGHMNNKGSINEYNHSVFVTIGIPLHELGYSIFLFDFRNHGLSDDKKPVSFGYYESDDVLGAVDYLRENADIWEIDKDRIAVWGTSFGAGTGLIATAKDNRSGDRYIKAMVSDSGYARALDPIKKRLSRYHIPCFYQKYLIFWINAISPISFSDINPIDEVGDIQVPIYLIHSSKDTNVPEHSSKDLFAEIYLAGNTSVTLWISDAIDHERTVLWYPEEYFSRISKFYDEALGVNN